MTPDEQMNFVDEVTGLLERGARLVADNPSLRIPLYVTLNGFMEDLGRDIPADVKRDVWYSKQYATYERNAV